MGCEADQPSEIVKAWIEPSIPLCTALVNPPRVDETNVDDIRSKLDGPRFLEKLSLAFVEVRHKRWELLEPFLAIADLVVGLSSIYCSRKSLCRQRALCFQ